MTTRRALRRVGTTPPASPAITGLWGRLRRLVMSGIGARRDVIHDQDGRHLLPPMHTARCLVVDAPHDRTELAGRPVTFEGLRLADGSYVGWSLATDAVALLRIARSGGPWWTDPSTTADEADVLWDARVIGSCDSVESAHAAADAVYAERG